MLYDSTFKPNRLLVYVVASDTGLAPNVTGGSCTLAVCKPQIRKHAKPESDWIIGMSTSKHGANRLIYASSVDERIGYANYWHIPRFHSKRPNAENPYGDNFNMIAPMRGAYCTYKQGIHYGNAEKIQRNHSVPQVLVGHRFWYFGANAPQLPDQFLDTRLVQGARRGHKVIDDAHIIDAFYKWITETYQTGIHGPPRDI
jgi:hypothetical protein